MSNWISTDDQGHSGQPGDGYCKHFAGVRRAKNGKYELHVRNVWGSNQGFLEEHGRVERKYRADDLDDLLRIGISEIRADEAFADAVGSFSAAVRNAIYAAQDIDADQPS